MSDDLDRRAADYVLGTLDANERAAFSREIGANPEARAAVAAWEKRLMPLATLIAPVAPPATLWPRIEGALSSADASVAQVAPVVAQVAPVAAQVAPFSADNVVVLQRKVRIWRAAAIAMGALAASLAIFVANRETSPRHKAGVYFAAVNRGGGRPALIVRVDMATNTVYVRSVSAEAPEGKKSRIMGDSARRKAEIDGSRDRRRGTPSGAAGPAD